MPPAHALIPSISITKASTSKKEQAIKAYILPKMYILWRNPVIPPKSPVANRLDSKEK
jgi:hypothetical protein